MTRKNKKKAAPPPLEIDDIDHGGDIVLNMEYAEGISRHFRCSRSRLRQNSGYFLSCLDPAGFATGKDVQAKLDALNFDDANAVNVSKHRLPIIVVPRYGQEHAVNAQEAQVVTRLFLRILHDELPSWPFKKGKSLQPRSVLSLLADGLEAVPAVVKYLRTDGRVGIQILDESELQVRHNLLVALLLSQSIMLQYSSSRLIASGSSRWKCQPGGLELVSDSSEEPWLHLPRGLEETISSVQEYFVSVYMDREHIQCKKGLSSSRDCDTYHLGQMLRFVTTRGSLQLLPILNPPAENLAPQADLHNGSLRKLLVALKQCPSYQLDAIWHAHCGPRGRMNEALDFLLRLVETPMMLGIELDPNAPALHQDSWQDDPCGGCWSFGAHRSIIETNTAPSDVRKIATAHTRLWD